MRVLDFLSEQGVDFEVKHHPRHFTAQEEAAAQHLPGHMFAKTVLVKSGEEFVLLVLPASHRVDLRRVEEVLGENTRLASEQEVGAAFPDCDLGAEPPFGSQYGMPTLVEQHLTDRSQIAVRAGSHTEVVLLAYADFARLEQPRVARFSDVEV